MSIRRVAKVFKSRPAIEGAGVHLKRAFGYSQVSQFDPFFNAGRLSHQQSRRIPPGFSMASAQGYREVVGHGWTDVERRCICERETVVLSERGGDTVQVTTDKRPVRSAGFRKTAQ